MCERKRIQFWIKMRKKSLLWNLNSNVAFYLKLFVWNFEFFRWILMIFGRSINSKYSYLAKGNLAAVEFKKIRSILMIRVSSEALDLSVDLPMEKIFIPSWNENLQLRLFFESPSKISPRRLHFKFVYGSLYFNLNSSLSFKYIYYLIFYILFKH